MARLLPREWAELATLAASWRPTILRNAAPPDRRTAALRLLATPESAARLQSDGVRALQDDIERVLGQPLVPSPSERGLE